jgi:hypothetical protein
VLAKDDGIGQQNGRSRLKHVLKNLSPLSGQVAGRVMQSAAARTGSAAHFAAGLLSIIEGKGSIPTAVEERGLV